MNLTLARTNAYIEFGIHPESEPHMKIDNTNRSYIVLLVIWSILLGGSFQCVSQPVVLSDMLAG